MEKTNMELLENIVEEINEEFRYLCMATLTNKEKIQLTVKSRKHMDEYEVEELLQGVINYVSDEFDVTFAFDNYYKNSIVCSIVEF